MTKAGMESRVPLPAFWNNGQMCQLRSLQYLRILIIFAVGVIGSNYARKSTIY